MRITFVLPTHGHDPVGGYKVVYEYANHLANRGHEITVVHPQILWAGLSWWKYSEALLRYAKRKIEGSYRPDSWFQIDGRVRLFWVWSLAEHNIPDADVIFATCWETAEIVARYSARKGRPYNLIQHWETWSGPEERVRATWKLPLKKIVIAAWLEAIADALGESSTLIRNGLDFDRFGSDVPPEARERVRVMMLYHDYDWKGSKDGLTALSIVRQQIPGLLVTLFGTPEKPTGLPGWIAYHRKPEQAKLRELYNEAAIFLAPSWTEGWGLPASEAMTCGAALVATDIGGHQEFAIDSETALLSPAKDPAGLARNLISLIQDDELRVRLAVQGNAYIRQFTWQRAVDALEATLEPG